jgi:hypothetical protein
MGGCSVAIPDLWSVENNPAGVSWLTGLQAGVSFENRFLLRELSYKTAGLSWINKLGGFGISVSHFGNALYGEWKTGLVYSRKFGRRISAGAGFSYTRISIGEGYGARGFVSCSAGLMYRPAKDWMIGMVVLNPVPVHITGYPSDILPVIFRAGLSFQPGKNILLTAEAEKDLEHPLVIRAGTEISLVKSISLRLGITSDPFMMTGGIGLEFGRLQAYIASGYHMLLGFTPSLSVSYALIK